MKKFDVKVLEEKYSDKAEEVGNCMLTTNNFIEAMLDEDCICLTFKIVRSEGAIVNPALVSILDICPTVITATAFLAGVKHSLFNKGEAGLFGKANPEEEQKVSDPKGLFRGVAGEEITGAIPIFICKEHWTNARVHMKPILGYITTLDPLGYSIEQLRVIPFLVMMKAALLMLKNPQNELYKRLFQYLEDTCKQILLDDHA